MKPIDLRSDTQTRPSDAMRQAMAEAPVGDDMYQEDPTINRLETMAAKRFGKEAAIFVASGVMGNLSSLIAHASPGDEVLLGAQSHVYYYEAGGLASIANLMPRPIEEVAGQLLPANIAAAIRPPDQHFPTPRLLVLENTHNRGGGRVTPLPLFQEQCAIARQHQLKLHLDGARLFNAEIATGTPVADFAAEVDSVCFCLSKGLGAPVGSVVVGDQAFIDQVRRIRKRLGGAMRQAGILAAAGIYALDHMVDRLAEDHEHARLLGERLDELPALKVELDTADTNMLFVDVTKTGLTAADFAKRLAAAGVLLLPVGPQRIRLVLYDGIDRTATVEAADRIRRFCDTL